MLKIAFSNLLRNYVLIIVNVFLLIVAASIAISLVYSTIRLGISPMPSSIKAFKTVLKLVDKTGNGAIIDLGSGWGNVVIPMARRYPQRPVIGYELSLLPWLLSTLLKKLFNLQNLTLHRVNFYNVKLPQASVIVCYLYPQAMKKIQNKLQLEQPNIDFLISNNFALPTWQVDQKIQLDDFYKSPIYLYKITNTRYQ